MIENRFWSARKYFSCLFGFSILTTAFGGFASYLEHKEDLIWWISIPCFLVAFMLTYLILDFAGIVVVEDEDGE